jgi:hypothetical protein
MKKEQTTSSFIAKPGLYCIVHSSAEYKEALKYEFLYGSLVNIPFILIFCWIVPKVFRLFTDVEK